jgi:hypothetical protein
LTANTNSQIENKDTASILRLDEHQFFGAGLASYYEHIIDLFTHAKCTNYLVDFAQIAIQQLSLDILATERKSTRSNKSNALTLEQRLTDLLSQLFAAALDSAQYQQAYSALIRIPDASIRKASLSNFATTLIAKRQTSALLSFPFASLSSDLDTAVSNAAHKSLGASASSSAPHFRALYSLRVQRGDFHGAAQALWDYLQTFKTVDGPLDPRDERIGDTYLLVINALRCCGVDEAWVLDDPAVAAGMSSSGVKFAARLSGAASGENKVKKRRVVFLADIRKEYQALLDRISDLEGGRFEFGADDEMEVDGTLA